MKLPREAVFALVLGLLTITADLACRYDDWKRAREERRAKRKAGRPKPTS